MNTNEVHHIPSSSLSSSLSSPYPFFPLLPLPLFPLLFLFLAGHVMRIEVNQMPVLLLIFP